MGRPPTHFYAIPPRTLNGFPQAVRVKPKTPYGGGLRPRWRDGNGDLLEWDFRHGRVERYNARGDHLGEFDHQSGVQLSPPDPGRKVQP